MSDEQEGREEGRRYPLLAIILPFVGVVFGAMLENGTDGLCKLGIVECRTPETEVTQLRSTVVGLQGNLSSALQIAGTCQNSLAGTVSQLRSLNSSIPPAVEAGSGAFARPQVVSLQPYKSRLDSVTQQVDQAQREIRELQQELEAGL